MADVWKENKWQVAHYELNDRNWCGAHCWRWRSARNDGSWCGVHYWCGNNVLHHGRKRCDLSINSCSTAVVMLVWIPPKLECSDCAFVPLSNIWLGHTFCSATRWNIRDSMTTSTPGASWSIQKPATASVRPARTLAPT